MSSLESIAVVGASLAGLRAVETLRRRGFDGRIDWIGAESELPYDRPPLSKEILAGTWEPDRIALRKDGYEALEVELHLGVAAVRLDTHARRIELADGRRVDYDGAVLCTGAAARAFPGSGALSGVFVLRTLDDALALRAALERGPRVVVIGGGFIGAEVAAACRRRGLDVAVVEPEEVPMKRGLGPRFGAVAAEMIRDEGVDLRCGVGVAALEGAGRVERVRLSDGTALAADVVVVGIGAVPATDWLADSGLCVRDGIVCDAFCCAGPPTVHAAGDVARWPNARFGVEMRVEHWTHAVEQGVYAAERLLGHAAAAEPFAPVPLVWSDQFGRKIQFAGRMEPDDEVHLVRGSTDERKFSAIFGRAGVLVGVLAFSRPRDVIVYRKMIAERTSWADAVAHAK